MGALVSAFSNRLRTVVGLLLVAGIALFGCAEYWVSMTNDQSEELAKEQHRLELRAIQLSEAAAQEVDATVRGIDTALKYLRTAYVKDRRNFDQSARDLLAAYPSEMFPVVVVIGKDGFLEYSSKLVTGDRPYFGDREHFQAQAKSDNDQLLISKAVTGRIVEAAMVQINRGIREGNDFLGTISIPLKLDYLSNTLKNLRVDPADELTIVHMDGSIIARNHNLEEALKTRLSADRPFIEAEIGQRGIFRSKSTVGAVPMLSAWQRIAAWPLIAVASVDELGELELIRHHHAEQQRNALVKFAFVFALTFGMAAFFIRINRKNHELTQSEKRLRKTIAFSESLSEAMPLPVFHKDALGRYTGCNEAFSQFIGKDRSEIIGKTVFEISPHNFAQGYKDKDLELLTSPIGTQSYEGSVAQGDGVVRDVIFHKARLTDSDGNPSGIVGVITDLTEHKKAQEKIQKLAYFDQLTGLPNRTLLLDRLKQVLSASSRSRIFGALLFIDLDKFKTLNDTLGHPTGDLLLQRVARQLTTQVRDGDTVARFGGDEFMILLVELSSDEADAASKARSISTTILKSLNQTYELSAVTYHGTASIGVTLFRGDISDIDDLLKQADLAMYKSKEGGRNSVRFFDPSLESAVRERAALEENLQRAVDENQFLLHYQAQVVGKGRVTGAEVLMRWQHPEQGLVSPALFIPLAEETGLILPMGKWVMEAACTQLAKWAIHPRLAELTIAVNVSVRQFRQTDFVDQVLEALQRTGANPRQLKLELTESLLAENMGDIIQKMFALKGKGVGFSLDDFGTGYSSLSYLKRLPLDQLKIDQSFVRDVLNDSDDAAIARTIVALGQSLGMAVIAEGVETEEQREVLASLGCHAYQGNLFSRPLPVEDFEVFAMRMV